MQKNRKDLIKSMCFNALFAALYVVLVLAFGDFSFGFTNGLISEEDMILLDSVMFELNNK